MTSFLKLWTAPFVDQLGSAQPAWRLRCNRKAKGPQSPLTERQRCAWSRRATGHILGRDEEIAMLMRRWERAWQGDGQLVMIVGEPGLGRSDVEHPVIPPAALTSRAHGIDRRFAGPIAIRVGMKHRLQTRLQVATNNFLVRLASRRSSRSVREMFSYIKSNGRRVSVHWFAGVLQSLCSPS